MNHHITINKKYLKQSTALERAAVNEVGVGAKNSFTGSELSTSAFVVVKTYIYSVRVEVF